MTIDTGDAVAVPLDQYEDLLVQFDIAKARVDQAEQECQILREQILKLLPTQEEAPDGIVGLINGRKRVSFTPSGRRRVNIGTLRDKYPSIATECTDHVVVWALRTHSV
jgi:hypothetical protein